MKPLADIFARHQTRLWVATVAIVAILALNLAARPRQQPGQWEYKTVVFMVQKGEPVATIQTKFDRLLNDAAAADWEFAGPCARLTGRDFGIDYIVLRRRVQ